MADDKSKFDKGEASAAGGKRPYATLDLKATEIRVTPLNATAAAQAGTRTATAEPVAEATPRPAPASSYAWGPGSPSYAAGASATLSAAQAAAAPVSASKTTVVSDAAEAAKLRGATLASAAASTAASTAGAGAASLHAATSDTAGNGRQASQGRPGNGNGQSSSAAPPAPVIVKKRGGFFSHLLAGVAGGALALAGLEYVLPQIGYVDPSGRLTSDTAALAQRLQAVEKQGTNPATEQTLAALHQRIANLEKTAQQIPALSESQSRLVAETKAALASAASDTGAPQQIERLAKIEERFNALAAAANDPNAGRLEQLAALTGKVSDLETSLATQLNALRKAVGEDVDARLGTIAQASEAAKSGTQRIDRDMAAVKTDTARLEERLQGLKAEADKIAASAKLAQEENAALRANLDAVRAGAAKPADVATAVAPVTQKLATLEQSVQTVMKAEDTRRASAERVVLAMQLQNLKRALDRGQGFAPELEDVKKAAGSAVDLSALDAYKDKGVATPSDLQKEFRSTANAIVDAAAEPASGGVIDRLVAGAKTIVRVRKTDHAPDDKSAEAVAGRMEVALREGRLADVITQGKTLPEKAQAAAQSFLDKVSARASVDNAVAQLEAQLKTSLAGAPAAEQPKATQ